MKDSKSAKFAWLDNERFVTTGLNKAGTKLIKWESSKKCPFTVLSAKKSKVPTLINLF